MMLPERCANTPRRDDRKVTSIMDTIVPQTAPQAQSDNLENIMQRPRVHVPLQELRDRYLNGESEKSLAEYYGVARSSIHNRLTKMGIPMRTQSETNRMMMLTRTPEENKRNTEAAHKVMRGRKIPFDEQCRLAKGRQEKPGNMSPDEITLRQLLANQGIITIPQLAIGPYNVDLAFKNIAIEIYGGMWHASGRHFARAKQRFDYIHGQGWNTIIIWTDTQQYPLSKNVIELIQTYVEEFQDASGQCKVIDGNGIEFSPDTIPYQRAIGL